MGLKDHTTDSAKLSEDQIEAIIAGYIKYDPSNDVVILLPKARSLPANKRVLMYLVALRGWEFLKGKDAAQSARPQEIERATGVLGGTLRPILRNLATAGILVDRHGRYEAPAHNLHSIGEILAGQDKIELRPRTTKQEKEKKKKRSNSASPAEGFKKLLETGWFKERRSTNDLWREMHKMTINVPVSDLPKILIKAYRAGRLDRDYEKREGKSVIVYFQK